MLSHAPHPPLLWPVHPMSPAPPTMQPFPLGLSYPALRPVQPNPQTSADPLSLSFRGRPCASTCLQCGWLTEEGPTGSRPTPVTFPTARLRAFVREREKRRALLYKKHNLAQVR